MDLTLDDDQRLLAESARQLFERTYPTSEARKAEERPERFSAELWTQAGELGWPGIALPEDVGGAGYGVLELAVLAEELGRAAVTLPLLTSYAAALPLLRAGRDARRGSGGSGPSPPADAVGALALLEPGGRSERAAPTLRGAATDGGWALSGTKLAVRFGARADVLVASADLGHGRPSLLAVPTDAPGIDRRAHDTFSPEPLAAVTFTDVVVGPDDVVGPGRAAAAIERALDHLGVLDTAYAVGLGDAALALTVDHTSNREQFGRPIGVNQAVSHQCVDMRVDIDAMRVLVHQAAWRLDRAAGGDDPAATRAVALANAYARDVIPNVFARAHQVHGAMGFTMEYDLQLFSRRAKSYELTGGGAAWHLEQVASSLGL